MATVIDRSTAIQKRVDVTIVDKRVFDGIVSLLEIWSTGASKIILEAKGGESFSGTFKQLQFRFDTKYNYIYTKSDVSQKEFDATYRGTVSEFSISGLSNNVNTVIRMAKNNNARDLSELYNAPAERIEVNVERSANAELILEPKEGFVKEGGWGGNPDPVTWEVIRMKDNPQLFKIVED